MWVSEVSLARTRERGAEERRARALLSPTPRGFAARSRVLERLTSLAQIGELARSNLSVICIQYVLCIFRLPTADVT